MEYKITNVSISDINRIKKIYKNGEENTGNDLVNEFNKRYKKEEYNVNVVNAKTFFCDLNNVELINIIKKYILVLENEYISNVHYINYNIGEKALSHVDTGSSIRTTIFLLNDNYEGGEFFLNDVYIPLKLGQILEFEADLIHEVKEIKNGNREVLVTWIKKSQKNKKTLL
jgi:hypothetical protein